jgi:UDP-2,3-diacylglucosamine pyrophosphatase LpxH
MTINNVDTLIVSDIHLGTRHAKPLELIRALEQYTFRCLIILGDVVDSPKAKLDSPSVALLQKFNQLASNGVEVKVIKGNHDGDILPDLFDSQVVNLSEEYLWHFGGTNYLAVHGDQFDKSLEENSSFIATIDALDWAVGAIDRWQLRHKLAKRVSWLWEKTANEVAQKAMEFAKQRQVDVVFCGHVHLEHEAHDGVIRYYNTGAWLNRPPSLVTICEKGIVRHWH